MSRPVDCGAMRERVTLERAGLTADGDTLFTPAATLWAAVEPLGLDETARGAGETGRAGVRVTIRWRDDVTSRDRLIHRGRRLRILATRDPDARRARLEALCEEEDR